MHYREKLQPCRKNKGGGGGKNLAYIFFITMPQLLAICTMMQSSMICNTVFKEGIY